MMNLLSYLAVSATVFQVIACTRLENALLPTSYLCGQEAKAWSDRFIRVLDSEDKAISGENLSAQIQSSQLKVSEKGCVNIPEERSSGQLTVRDNRPAKQEGKILSLDTLTFPASINMEVLSIMIPQFSCESDQIETNAKSLEVQLTSLDQNKSEHLRLEATLRGRTSIPLAIVMLDEHRLKIELGDHPDGDYSIDIVGIDKIRQEKTALKTCKLHLDRTAPMSSFQQEQRQRDSDGFTKIRIGERLPLVSDDHEAIIYVSLNAYNEVQEECSESFVASHTLTMPKQGKWQACYYVRDKAGNSSKPTTIQFIIDEEPRRLNVEHLIENAKLNIENYRYETARESLAGAYAEWQRLGLAEDRQQLLPLLKAAFLQVIQKYFLRKKLSINTHNKVFGLDKDTAVVVGDDDISLVSLEDGQRITGQSDLKMLSGSLVDTTKKRLVISDQAGRIRLIDRELKTLAEYSDPEQVVYTQMAISDDGNLLAASSLYGRLLIWDMHKNSIVARSDLRSRIFAMVFDAQQSRLLFIQDDNLKALNYQSQAPASLLASFQEPLKGLHRLSPTVLLLASTESLFTYDLESKNQKKVYSNKKNLILETSTSPDRKFTALMLDSSEIRVLSNISFKTLENPELLSSKFLNFSLSNTHLVAVDANGFAKIFDLFGFYLSAVFRITDAETVQGLWWNGEQLISNTSKSLCKWDIRNPLLTPFALPDALPIEKLTGMSYDGEYLHLAFKNGRILKANQQEYEEEIFAGEFEHAYTILGDNKVVRLSYESVKVFDRSNLRRPIASFKIDAASLPESFTWIKRDETFMLGSEGLVKSYDLQGRLESSLTSFRSHYRITAIAIAENQGPVVAGGDIEGYISIWPKQGSDQVAREYRHKDLRLKVNKLVFINQRQFIGGADGDDGARLYLWESTGEALQSIVAHTSEVRDIVHHSSEGEILSIGNDRLLRVWNTKLEALGAINLPAQGKQLASASQQQNLAILLDNGQAMMMPHSLTKLAELLSQISGSSNR